MIPSKVLLQCLDFLRKCLPDEIVWRSKLKNSKEMAMRNTQSIGGRVVKILTLQQLRTQRGLLQQEMAKRLGVAGSVVSRLESQTNPKLETLKDYVEALGARLVVVAEFDTPVGIDRHILRMPGTACHLAAPVDVLATT